MITSKNNSKAEYNVLIVGAGNIGALYDSPDSQSCLTHSHAFFKHEGFNLLGFVDSNTDRAEKAAERWRRKAYKTVKEAFLQEKVDIVSVAVPVSNHYKILKELSSYPVKLVFTEKPLTKTLEEGKEIVDIYNKKEIPAAMNYIRRFAPEFEEIKKNIELNIYGDYLTGTAYYGKGIINNGSHIIDLLNFFNFHIKKIIPIDTVADFSKEDRTVSAVLVFRNNRKFFLEAVDCRNYEIFEMDLLFEKKRVKIIDTGFKIEEYDIAENELFKGYRNPVKRKERETALASSLFFAAHNIYEFLTENKSLKCNLSDGYKTLETCIKILETEPEL